MDGFVLRMPAQSGEALLSDTPRLARLARANWRADAFITGMQTALSGRAAFGQSGPWKAIGLAALYNADELRARHPDAGEGDIALIAHLRALHGPEFPEHLSGGFAIVLIHTGTGEIEAYRDHFGIIPFYYCIHEAHLTCSSDMRAALHLSELPVVDNPVRIADFLTEHEIDREITALSGLMRLPAAHRLDWTEGTIQKTRYWSLSLPPEASGEGAPDKLRTLLERATVGCFHNIESVGAMLSGGLDSSSLAGIAARTQHDRDGRAMPTLSFVYGAGNPMDESPYIDAANATFPTLPHPIPMTTAPRLSDMSDVIEEQMDFFLAFGLQKSRNIYRVAEEQGLTALIDGHGGDEVISHGFDRMIELAADRQWGRLFVEMRGVSKLYGRPFLGAYCLFIVRHSGLAPRNLLRRILNRIARQLLPRKAPEGDTDIAIGILTPTLREQVDPDLRYAEDPGPTTREDKLKAERIGHLKNLQHQRGEIAFEVLHRSAARHGILPLYPFYDRDLVEFCLSLPSEMKMRKGRTRWVLREAMRGVLPEKIRTRSTKTDFTDEFRSTVLEHLNTEGANAFKDIGCYVDAAQVERLYQSLSDTEGQTVSALRLWWRLAVLAQWQTAFETWQSKQARGELI